MALPTVMTLSALCSILLIAQWRNLALAEGLGRSADKRWQMQQQAIGVLLATTDQLQSTGCEPKACPPLSGEATTLAHWQSQSAKPYSLTELDGTQQLCWVEVWPAQASVPNPEAAWVYRLTALVTNPQGQVVGWQAVWHPHAQRPASLQQPLPLQGFERLLALAP
jgi:hypothetical protein